MQGPVRPSRPGEAVGIGRGSALDLLVIMVADGVQQREVRRPDPDDGHRPDRVRVEQLGDPQGPVRVISFRLLLETGAWADVKPLLDFAAFIAVPRDMVRTRLMRRHGEEGLFTEERNRAHIERNDLPNYDLVMQTQERADLVIELVVTQ